MAVQWLVKRPKMDRVPGFEELAQSTGWEKGLLYYYYSGLARVLPRFPASAAKQRRQALLKQLVTKQRPDGSWKNDSARMREDDPLICTSLALISLGALAEMER